MAERDPILKHAFKKAETARRLAGLLGISPQAVSQWRRCPAERVLEVEHFTGVARHTLRPDLYPAPSDIQAAPHAA